MIVGIIQFIFKRSIYLMGRKKIEIKYIKNHRQRKITFHKRRKGLIKKIQQLALLCGIEARLEIYDAFGNKTAMHAGNVPNKKENEVGMEIYEEESGSELGGTLIRSNPKLEKEVRLKTTEPHNCEQTVICQEHLLKAQLKQNGLSSSFVKLDPMIVTCPNFSPFFMQMGPTYLPPIYMNYPM